MTVTHVYEIAYVSSGVVLHKPHCVCVDADLERNRQLVADLATVLRDILRKHQSLLCGCSSECGDCHLHVLLAKAEGRES